MPYRHNRVFLTGVLAMLMGLSACGAASSNAPRESAEQMKFTSSAFREGQPIPADYSCDNRNISPPLAWSGVPDGTKSLVLTIDDPDAAKAPGGTFRHWAAYDIPPNLRDLPEGAGDPENPAFKQSLHDGGQPGYTGPCPPKGDPPHHYHFHLFALDVAELQVPQNAKVSDVEAEAAKHKLAETELVGTFQRK